MGMCLEELAMTSTRDPRPGARLSAGRTLGVRIDVPLFGKTTCFDTWDVIKSTMETVARFTPLVLADLVRAQMLNSC